jgi:UDP-3-O-acyl-N-acetylglucosamine deacetylase
MAKDLHRDSITFEYSAKAKETRNMVRFLHFEGVSPQQYASFFKVQTRKNKEGKFIPIQPNIAEKSIAEYLDNYKDFEVKAVEHFNKDLSKLEIKNVIDKKIENQ